MAERSIAGLPPPSEHSRGAADGTGYHRGNRQLLVRRLMADTDWDGLDYLVVDLLPGTADTQDQLDQALLIRPC